ncbi:MAG: hypothetical protein ACR2PO_12000 [Methyloligellaceae bacterium]
MADGQEQTAEKAPDVVSVGDDIAAAMKELDWDGEVVSEDGDREGASEVSDRDGPGDGLEDAEGAEASADDGDQAAADDDGGAEVSEDDDGSEDDATDEATDTDTVEPPEHWSEADRNAFAELPDEAKPLYLDKAKSLERGYQAKFETLSEDACAGNELRDVFQPFQPQLDREGIDRVGALRRLVAAHDLLTRDADQGLPWLAGQTQYRPKDARATVKAIAAAWGVEVGASDEGQAEEIIDPAANTKITALEAKIAELEKHNSSSSEAEQTRRMGEAQATLQAFTTAKDDAGRLKHPHYETVKQRMGVMIASGAAQTLEDAYDQAVWSEPALRGDLLKTQQAAQKNGDDRKTRLQRNKRATTKVKSDKSGGRAAPSERSLRDELTANFDEAGIT